MEVKKVDLTLLKSQPPRLVINASGLVTTSGWVNGRLEPRFYIQFPADGIQDFDFVADPPEGITLMVILPITAKPVEWDNLPAALKGVRVHAQSNKIEALLDQSSPSVKYAPPTTKYAPPQVKYAPPGQIVIKYGLPKPKPKPKPKVKD